MLLIISFLSHHGEQPEMPYFWILMAGSSLIHYFPHFYSIHIVFVFRLSPEDQLVHNGLPSGASEWPGMLLGHITQNITGLLYLFFFLHSGWRGGQGGEQGADLWILRCPHNFPLQIQNLLENWSRCNLNQPNWRWSPDPILVFPHHFGIAECTGRIRAWVSMTNLTKVWEVTMVFSLRLRSKTKNKGHQVD